MRVCAAAVPRSGLGGRGEGGPHAGPAGTHHGRTFLSGRETTQRGTVNRLGRDSEAGRRLRGETGGGAAALG